MRMTMSGSIPLPRSASCRAASASGARERLLELGCGQAVVIGDRQPYLCAILALEEEALPGLCKAAGVPVASLAEIAGNEKVRAFLADRVESDCNSKVARYQTIKKFEVLPHMLSVEGGELTPTFKVKRNIIIAKYKAIIDSMYMG